MIKLMNSYFNKFLVLFFLLIIFSVDAQQLDRINPKVVVNGQELEYPWAGGLNAPQFSQIDLNDDGIPDIFIFDRVGGVPLAFEAYYEGSIVNYRFAPELVENFPLIRNWAMLRDFDGDGIADLFAYSENTIHGIRIFKGSFVNGKLSFELITWPDQSGLGRNLLWYRNPINGSKITNLYVSNIDYPAVYDVDGDGDLDILTFDPGGFTMHYYKNMSVELGHGLDSLIFYQVDKCWGGFYESGISTEVNLSPESGKCFEFLNEPIDRDGGPRHEGSTVCAFDATGNGLTDLILGDISFSNIALLLNGGTIQEAWIVDQDPMFPSNDIPADVPVFPAAFHIDVDLDGFGDIIVAPNNAFSILDTSNVFLYKNTGNAINPEWHFETNSFLSGGMIDLGTGAIPAFFDYNGDGLMDIVCGVYNRYSPGGTFSSRLYLFENKGTLTNPEFELVDSDYLSFSQFSQGNFEFAFAPYFADLDGDGDLDLLVGNYEGRLYYAENTGGPGNAAVFPNIEYLWMNIDVGLISVPYVYDLDGDGLPDLLIGERNGNINYLKNTGTPTSPFFNSNLSAPEHVEILGLINTRGVFCSSGVSSAAMVFDGGELKLLAGSFCDGIQSYRVNTDDLSAGFEKEVGHPVSMLNEGYSTRFALADITGDGNLEMVVGNDRGGLSMFSTSFREDSTVNIVNNDFAVGVLNIYPNPANAFIEFTVDFLPSNGDLIEITDIQGRVLKRERLLSNSQRIDVSAFPSGIFFLRVQGQRNSAVAKFIKS